VSDLFTRDRNDAQQRHLSRPGETLGAEPRIGFLTTLGGTTAALLSALLTSLLLLINGSATLVFLGSLTRDRPDWMEKQGLLQFVLFTLPLAMLVVEWVIWDFVRGLVSPGLVEDD
jgi:hypothetical protein